MKNRFILLILTINLTGCSVFKPASRNTDNLSAAGNNQASGTKSKPVFLQNISTGEPGDNPPTKSDGIIPVKNSGSNSGEPVPIRPVPHPVGTDDYNQLKF